MLRVLHVVGKMHRAGQETNIMNLFRTIDREQVLFDFLVHTQEPCAYDEEICALGGRIHRVRKAQEGVVSYVRAIRDLVRREGYDIVHLHTAHSAGFLVLLAAKMGGANVRIAHSRSTRANPLWLHYLLLPCINHFATDRFACSDAAGRWMFGNAPFTTIYDGFDIARFAYNKETRATVRAQLGLMDAWTIGHVGRFSREKNHAFLLEVMAHVVRKRPGAVLLLVGEGELREDMRAQAERLHISDNVRFLGARGDVAELLQAMDVFLLPSLFEGFCNALLEAEISGLPYITSDKISEETYISPNYTKLPITNDTACYELWAQTILEAKTIPREDISDIFHAAGLDISQSAGILQNFYQGKEKP